MVQSQTGYRLWFWADKRILDFDTFLIACVQTKRKTNNKYIFKAFLECFYITMTVTLHIYC